MSQGFNTILGYQYEPEGRVEEDDNENEFTSVSSQNNENSRLGRVGNTHWCQCGKCEQMKNVRDSICCKEFIEISYFQLDEHQCITTLEDFKVVVLLKSVLWTALVALHKRECPSLAPRDEVTNKSYRFAAYRQFSWFIFSNLQKGDRRVLPSCVVNIIRQTYPSPDGQYVGFKDTPDSSEVDNCWSADGNCQD